MTADARRLVRRLADTGSPRGTVLISHGYGEHSGRYLPLQEALVGAGYDIAFYDHTGHGTSGGPRGRVDAGALIRDHLAMRRLALAGARTPDLFLFGHSMGGVVTAASTLIDSERLRGTVLSAPAMRPLPPASASLARKAAPLARLLPSLVVRPPQPAGGESPLSRDPRVQQAFDADPLCYHGGVQLLTGVTMIIQGDEVLRHAHLARTPILVMHGSADRMADLAASRDFVAEAEAANPGLDVRLRVVDGAYHELLNEPEGPGLIRDIIIWLGEH